MEIYGFIFPMISICMFWQNYGQGFLFYHKVAFQWLYPSSLRKLAPFFLVGQCCSNFLRRELPRIEKEL